MGRRSAADLKRPWPDTIASRSPSAQGGPARSEARDHSRRGRDAAAAAPGGRGQGRRNVRVRRTDRREGGARGGHRGQNRRRRSARRRASSSRGAWPGNWPSRRASGTRSCRIRRANTAIFALGRASRRARRGAARWLRWPRSTRWKRPRGWHSRTACDREAEIFRMCLFSTQSKALIHAFFGERAVSKIPDIPKETKTLRHPRAAIIGAGTMGGGIAMNYANAGIPVIVRKRRRTRSTAASATIRKNYENSVQKGPFFASRDGSAHGADHAAAHLRRLRAGRHHRRSRV